MRGIKLRAVDDVSLDIAEQQIFGLLGPNGCGKSTVMKMLLGLVQPSRGECSILGVSSRQVASRREVGFLPEAPYFYRFLSGAELLQYSAKMYGMPRRTMKKRIREVLQWVDLHAASERKVGTYSKGMLQRIGIAQALVHDPKVLVLDEPTAGLDPIGCEQIGALLLSLKKQGRTIFLCSHLLAQMERLCDRFAMMNRGKLIIEGAAEELLKTSFYDLFLQCVGGNAPGPEQGKTQC